MQDYLEESEDETLVSKTENKTNTKFSNNTNSINTNSINTINSKTRQKKAYTLFAKCSTIVVLLLVLSIVVVNCVITKSWLINQHPITVYNNGANLIRNPQCEYTNYTSSIWLPSGLSSIRGECLCIRGDDECSCIIEKCPVWDVFNYWYQWNSSLNILIILICLMRLIAFIFPDAIPDGNTNSSVNNV